MSDKPSSYERFPVAQRIEHLLLFLSFTTLAITGLVQKYINVDISLWLIQVFGGISAMRIIHRVSATIFLFEIIYHFVLIGYKSYVECAEMTMLPGIKDVKDGIQAFGYNFGLKKSRPKQGRYTFDEKAEYWALMWGGAVMAITGFMLWNPIVTAHLLPGVFIPAAKAAHGGESVLAVLAILVWHFYHVHSKRFNKSIFNGKLEHHEMEEDHALELEKIKAGVGKFSFPPEVIKKRRSIFFPIAAVFSLASLVGIYFFVTVETTAISTLPPAEQVQVLATSIPTPIPTATPTVVTLNMNPNKPQETDLDLTTWDGGIGVLMQQKCGMCHGASGDLSLATYADAVNGG
ncbi:MAG: hypothetical protein C0391_00285 [Anaerolinea sp.]|nr:hypothetical protein [Anaerolinea sp.]